MDDTLKVEFPLGEGGRVVAVRRPTDHQLFALTLIRRPTSASTTQERATFMARVLSLVESLIQPNVWGQIETDMLRGELSPEDLLLLVNEVLQFRWATVDAPMPEHGEESDSRVPERPAPRIVRGG